MFSQIRMVRRSFITGLGAALLAAPQARADAASLAGFGVVLMHGKGGQGGDRVIAGLATAMRGQGALVASPTMAWGGRRGQPSNYDVGYLEAIAAIGGSIAELKQQGARRIVVAGQSLGANAAIGYAAEHGRGLAGVISLACGQFPELQKDPAILDSVQRARAMVAAGQGNTEATFADSNVGQSFTVSGTAVGYLSYNDPNGPAVVPRNAARMPPIPFLWVVGDRDGASKRGPSYAFDQAPSNPKSKYLVVSADHLGTPDAATPDVIAWLKTL